MIDLRIDTVARRIANSINVGQMVDIGSQIVDKAGSTMEEIIVELKLHLENFTEEDCPLRIGNDRIASAYDISWDMILRIREFGNQLSELS